MSDETNETIAANPLVAAVRDAVVSAHAENVAVSHASLRATVDAMLEAHEQDLASIVRPLLAPALANDDHADTVHDLFAMLSAPEHQTQFFTAIFAIKGIIDGFVSAALAPYVEETTQTAWNHKPIVRLTPDELALAVLRENVDTDYAVSEAQYSGIDADRFNVMVLNTGEPPGIQQMLELFRRGELSEADLTRAIRQSRIRPEWIDSVIKMRYVVPSSAEVIAGLVEGHLTTEQALEKYGEAGGRPDNFAWQYETAGRPPGAEQMLHLWNRGEVTEQQVIDAIKESNIKDKYVPQILELRRYVPPPRSVVAMIRQGAISDELATEYLKFAGVTDADTKLFIKSGHSTRATAQKELSVGAIVKAYGEDVITRDQAHAQIVAAGYTGQAADITLETADAALEHKYAQALVTHAHNLFVKFRLTEAQARHTLLTAGVHNDNVDALITEWTLERSENVRLLSKAEILGAYRRGVRDEAWATGRLLFLGYDPADLDVLLAEAFPPPKK